MNRPGEPVKLPDDHGVKAAPMGVGHQPVELAGGDDIAVYVVATALSTQCADGLIDLSPSATISHGRRGAKGTND